MYKSRLMYQWDKNAWEIGLKEAKLEAKEKAKSEVKLEARLEEARRIAGELKKAGLTFELIAKTTELSIKEIEAL